MYEQRRKDLVDKLNQALLQVQNWTRTQYALEGQITLLAELEEAAVPLPNGEDKPVQELKE